MKRSSEIIALGCALSTFLMGCHTATVICPAGPYKEKIYSGRINTVSRIDGKQFEFNEAPVIVNDTIVGMSVLGTYPISQKQVSIPLSEVATVSVVEFDSWKTTGLVIGGGAFLLLVYLLSTTEYYGIGLN